MKIAGRNKTKSKGWLIRIVALIVAAFAAWKTYFPTPAQRSCQSQIAGEQVFIRGGRFQLGASKNPLSDALPSTEVRVNDFWIDRTEVTNAEFRQFIAATAYQTTAESLGSAVFYLPDDDKGGGWELSETANWEYPYGDSSVADPEQPVVHISYADAMAYAQWRGRDLPTEAEWEFAARAGLYGASFEWGEKTPEEANWPANTWQGPFPRMNTAEDGFAGLAPVGCYPQNAYSLFDMTGNAWEWVHSPTVSGRGLIKGGSFLCAKNYCARYQPAARLQTEENMTSNHIGFRTVCRERCSQGSVASSKTP